jgi:hypothetical protein
MYNGWLHSVFVTGCFLYGVDGCLVWARHNFVGSWNDGDTSRDLQIKLADETINVDGHGVLSDSAFPVSEICFNRILTPLKENDYLKHPRHRHGLLRRISSAITSMRQSAE